jgi:ferredoxin
MNEAERSQSFFQVTLNTPFRECVVTAGRSQHLWDAAQAAGVFLPAICHQGRCLTCAGQLLEPGDFDSNDAESYFQKDREAGFVLLCTAKPCSDLHVRTHMEAEMRMHRLKYGLPAPYA